MWKYLFALTLVLTQYACVKDESSPAVIVNVTIKQPPIKTIYFNGDNLNLEGLEVLVTYSDGKQESVGVNDLSAKGLACEPNNGAILSTGIGEMRIIHSETGISTTQPLTVSNIVVSEVIIKNQPDKTHYYVGDALDLKGLVATLVYNNGAMEDIPFDAFFGKGISCTPYNGSILASTYATVTVSHVGSGVGVLLPIEIEKVVLQSVEIKQAPLKVDYYEGDKLNLTGLIVTLHYNNGSSADATYAQLGGVGLTCTPSHDEVLTLGTATLKIGDGHVSVNQDIQVIKVEPVSMSLKTMPSKLNYKFGDVLNFNGLVVTLVFNNQKVLDVPYADFPLHGITCDPANGTVVESVAIHVAIRISPYDYTTGFDLSATGIVKDIQGNSYGYAVIGTQTWMIDNLKTTKFNNGDNIPTTIVPTINISSETAPMYQWVYENNTSNLEQYGRLYTWPVVADSRNICPTGWHVPTYSEYVTLVDYLGGTFVAGGKLKATTMWSSPNTDATNSSQFWALPAGMRSGTGVFKSSTFNGYFWTVSEYPNTIGIAYFLYLGYDNGAAQFIGTNKYMGYSVRCLKD